MFASRRKVVATRIRDGLGNQMFQYAAGLSLAEKFDAPLALELSWFTQNSDRQFLLRHWKVDAPEIDRRTIEAKWQSYLAKRLPRGMAKIVSPSIHWEHVLRFDQTYLDLKPPVLLRGAYQSYRYFSSIEAKLRELFQPRNELSANTQAYMQAVISSPWSVSLHVRRGDYLTNQWANEFIGTCSNEFYRAGMAHIERQASSKREGKPHYFLFTDDPDWVRQTFADLPNSTVVSGNDLRPWEDMLLIAACNDHIISNSTFSWWGAWLNPKPDACVFAPRAWLSDPKDAAAIVADLIPPHWTLWPYSATSTV